MPAIDLREPTRIRALILASSLAATVACAPVASPRFPARPPGCSLEPVERLPRRPYLELETFSLPGPESMREVLDTVSERACRDGADAVYAPKGGRTYSYAIAIKWNDAAPPAPAPAAPPAPAPAAPPAPAPAAPPAPAPAAPPALAPAAPPAAAAPPALAPAAPRAPAPAAPPAPAAAAPRAPAPAGPVPPAPAVPPTPAAPLTLIDGAV